MIDRNRRISIVITPEQSKILLMHTESMIKLVHGLGKTVIAFENMISDIQRQLIDQGVTRNPNV